MTFDRPEHKELILDMINKISVPGELIELFYELKKAAETAAVEGKQAGTETATHSRP